MKTALYAALTVIMLGLGLWWTIYQWQTCMHIINNTWYCYQHIG